jgi:hypothetical protein
LGKKESINQGCQTDEDSRIDQVLDLVRENYKEVEKMAEKL